MQSISCFYRLNIFHWNLKKFDNSNTRNTEEIINKEQDTTECWLYNWPIAPHGQHHHDVETADCKDKVKEWVAVSDLADLIVVHWLTTVNALTMLIYTSHPTQHISYMHIVQCQFNVHGGLSRGLMRETPATDSPLLIQFLAPRVRHRPLLTAMSMTVKSPLSIALLRWSIMGSITRDIKGSLAYKHDPRNFQYIKIILVLRPQSFSRLGFFWWADAQKLRGNFWLVNLSERTKRLVWDQQGLMLCSTHNRSYQRQSSLDQWKPPTLINTPKQPHKKSKSTNNNIWKS